MVLSLELLPLFKLAAGNLVHKYDMHEGRSTRERERKNLNCKGEREKREREGGLYLVTVTS